MPDEEIEQARVRLARLGFDLPPGMTKDQIRQALVQRGEEFRAAAPMTASEAAKLILDGVRSGTWRILVGEDAVVLDQMVREAPEQAYDPPFMQELIARTGWRLGA